MSSKNKRRDIGLAVVWIIILAADLVGTVYFIYNGSFTGPLMVVAIAGSILMTAIAVFCIRHAYLNYIKPERLDEKTGETDQERYEAKIHRRQKGKDMFEVCDNIRRQYFITLFVVLGIVSLLLPMMFILKFNEYDYIDIPFWWAFIVSAVIMGISIFATRKYDLAFYTSLHLRMENRKKGYDEFYVNNDFMMATYHDLLKGILAIGQSYYVVFMQKFVSVGEMNDISMVTHFSTEYKLNGQKLTRHFIKITNKDGSWVSFPAGGEMAADMIMREFARAGLSTETLPTVKETKQNTKK